MARDLTGVLLKDKWRIDAQLGEGGVAAVYSATHRNGKCVAVKILHAHLASTPEMRERFLREGYVANRVEHPGTVSVLDDDVTDDGLVFLVMDLLAGESLERRLSRGRLPVGEVLTIIDSLLDVLVAAHAKGIIHRDIKPENIFLLKDGGQKLLDFGIARLHEQSSGKNATQSGAAMGTPAYMPPEQARGRWELVDGRTDLWAVGATMFALLTGRSVHEAETLNETLLLAMSQPAPALVTVWPEAPRMVAAIVDRALRFNVSDRWPSAASMRSAVQTARQALESQPQLPATPFVSQPTIPATQVTPPPATGTVLAAAVSDVGPPAPPFLSTSRGRAIVGGSVGGVVLIAGVLALTLGHGKNPAADPVTAAIPPPTSAVTTLPSPSVALSDSVGAVAPSASAGEDVSQLPVAPAVSTAPTTPAPPPVPTVAAPRPAPPPAQPPAPKPPAAPTSNPLDRRH